ncbi:MAG: DNA recombination protein RmuC, partial [Candidatus Eisenbacteria bacterium]|nr:DNA recombination protein RmuC [Candidatus Eisenbacteria bacterium]
FETERATKYGSLEKGLQDAAAQTAKLASSTEGLRSLLDNSRARGQWGERMADDILRASGLQEGTQYLKNRALDTSTSAPALRAALLALLRVAQAAQPSMALIHQFAARALEIADAAVPRGDEVADLRAHLAHSCAAERQDLAAATFAVAHQALALIEEREPWIATLSASRTVCDAMLAARRAGLAPRALVAEGRPGREGRAMAATLAAAGIPVWLVVDAALPLLLSQARMVWIGADAVTDQGVVNKIGSFAVAIAAREHSVPVYALATRRKFLPATTAALRIVEMPPSEVWKHPAEGVLPRNVYFESVPLALLRGVVVENAVLGASEVATTARERALPDELAGTP